jgi:hypothetical protein
MKKNTLAHAVCMIGLSLWVTSSYSAPTLPTLPAHDNPSTPLGPTLKGRYSSLFIPSVTYSLLGEAGLRQARIGGTLGWQFSLNQRLKLSAEYLWQEITYAFFTDDVRQWVNQGAIGISYEYLFLNDCFAPSFDLEGYYSHAPTKSLTTQRGLYIDKFGDTRSYVLQRRTAGSNAAGLAPGISITPWFGGRAGLKLNYDNVSYSKKYFPNKEANGLGTTIQLTQALSEFVFVAVSGAFRRPFNNYTAKIGWLSVPYYGGLWTLGFDAAYTMGKETLHSSWDVGLDFEYFLGPYPVPLPLDLNVDCRCPRKTPMPPNNQCINWTARPSIYQPQVLAIEDERVTTNAT